MARKTNTSATQEQRLRPSTMSRKQIAIRFFTYGVMAIATVIGVIVCIGYAMGYRFDFRSGQLSQVALLQFNTFPTGASVDVNGTRLTTRTPTRSNIKTGETEVSMSLQGYRPWRKTVSALPSSVRWLDYVRLVPQNVRTESIRTFTDVVDMLSTPNKKWAALLTDDAAGAMTLVDLSNPKQPKFTNIELNSEQITQPAENEENKYRLVEWDSDSRYLLIEHQHGESTEHLIYDRQSKETRNLTRDFSMDLRQPHFSGSNGDVIFAITGSDLRKIDYGNKSISAPIANDVVDYVLYSNSRIAFISQREVDDEVQQTVSIYDDGKISEIKQYDGDDIVDIAFSRNNDTDYLAIARGETVSVIPDPLDSHNSDLESVSTDIAYLTSPGGIDWMMMSDNGRFVLAGRGRKVVSYDVETTENYSFELEYDGRPQWLDGYHLLDIRDGSVTMVEFDGQNSQHIVSGKLPAFLSHDGEYLFSLDDISGGVVLQRSTMTTNN